MVTYQWLTKIQQSQVKNSARLEKTMHNWPAEKEASIGHMTTYKYLIKFYHSKVENKQPGNESQSTTEPRNGTTILMATQNYLAVISRVFKIRNWLLYECFYDF